MEPKVCSGCVGKLTLQFFRRSRLPDAPHDKIRTRIMVQEDESSIRNRTFVALTRTAKSQEFTGTKIAVMNSLHASQPAPLTHMK